MNVLAPSSTVERYFSLHYGLSLARKLSAPGTAKSSGSTTKATITGEDTCIARHHNGVCVICISPRHPIITNKLNVINVEYRREMREVKGKKKKGGLFVENRTRLCSLTCDSGDVYSVQCAVKGTLVEYNDALSKQPELVGMHPLTNGYLATVLPSSWNLHTAVDDLMTAIDYDAMWAEGLRD